jgi:hypothetical protein
MVGQDPAGVLEHAQHGVLDRGQMAMGVVVAQELDHGHHQGHAVGPVDPFPVDRNPVLPGQGHGQRFVQGLGHGHGPDPVAVEEPAVLALLLGRRSLGQLGLGTVEELGQGLPALVLGQLGQVVVQALAAGPGQDREPDPGHLDGVGQVVVQLLGRVPNVAIGGQVGVQHDVD